MTTVTPQSAAAAKNRNTRAASMASTLFVKLLNDKDPLDAKRNSGAWVVAVYILEKNPGLEVLRQNVMDKLISRFGRLRSVMTMDAKLQRAVFTDVDGEFDMNYHMPDISKETENFTRDQLFQYVGDLNSFQYDLTKPLWRYILIPKLADGRAAIISCVNHAVGDGLALIDVAEALYDPIPVDEPVKKNIKHQGKKPVVRKLDFLSQLGIFLYGAYFGLTLTFAKPDPPNILRLPDGQKPVGKKCLATAEPISLDRFKEIKDKMEGTTINDILMAVMTLTIKALFVEKGSYKPGERVTAQFPFSTRGVGEGGLDIYGEPHNKISYAFYNFQFEGDRLDAVWNTKHEIDSIKLSPAPYVMVQNVKVAMALLSDSKMMDLTAKVGNFGTAQLSNVPAPQGQVSTCGGVKIDEMGFFLFSPLSCYLGILTYNNVVNTAFNLDSGLGLDPKDLARHWNNEFDQLYKEVMEKAGSGTIPEPVFDTEYYRKIAKGFLYTLAVIAVYWMLSILRRRFAK